MRTSLGKVLLHRPPGRLVSLTALHFGKRHYSMWGSLGSADAQEPRLLAPPRVDTDAANRIHGFAARPVQEPSTFSLLAGVLELAVTLGRLSRFRAHERVTVLHL